MDLHFRNVGVAGDVTVFEFSGRIEPYDAEVLRKQMKNLVSIGSIKLVCDMRNVEFVGGAALSVFYRAMQSTKKRGGGMTFFGMNESLKKEFLVEGMGGIVQLYPSEADAVAFFENETETVMRGNDAECQEDLRQTAQADTPLDDIGFRKTMPEMSPADVEALRKKKEEKKA